jgi:hypothetical protein
MLSHGAGGGTDDPDAVSRNTNCGTEIRPRVACPGIAIRNGNVTGCSSRPTGPDPETHFAHGWI